jgi:hypothetical protein
MVGVPQHGQQQFVITTSFSESCTPSIQLEGQGLFSGALTGVK